MDERAHPEHTPGSDVVTGFNDDDLQELISRVFSDEELDWDATRGSARTIEDLRLLRNLYGMWKIYEFNRLVIEGEDPRETLGPER